MRIYRMKSPPCTAGTSCSALIRLIVSVRVLKTVRKCLRKAIPSTQPASIPSLLIVNKHLPMLESGIGCKRSSLPRVTSSPPSLNFTALYAFLPCPHRHSATPYPTLHLCSVSHTSSTAFKSASGTEIQLRPTSKRAV